ncbi:Myb-like DNA-binding domain containing protein [Tritrichomonas foetus]|uniref:Myb-like DNA-binding domain containing protein n=1 Tax=Tritrichomonas foetus TaxID=1144522 RepID=A0A1J4KBW4_9EUKA|nr:Myb-like DNA-binding domain containing protein [Tritrichomonas foetus]|eukprot:OHT08416.1 Myb-like DNA-binding domain containing protein [Tritrichomonas foetus]
MTAEAFLGLNLMVEVAISYVDGFTSNLTDVVREALSSAFSDYLHDVINYDQCRDIVVQLVGRDDALIQLHEIMTLPEEPLPTHDDPESFDGQSPLRKKTRTWTATEDKRLLAGVARYGVDNWQFVAHFVGNGRNRAQCSQRWTRGLNPKISKKNWTPEDDKQLQELVNLYGDKSWTKIANILGNRSDVQCRYHYRQLTNTTEENNASGNSNNNEGSSSNPNVPLNKSSITMSSDRLVLKQESPPSNSPITNEQDRQHMSLFTGRTYLSSPGLIMPKISGVSPLTLPLAPITPRLRHAQEQAAAAQANQMLANNNNNSLLNNSNNFNPSVNHTVLPQINSSTPEPIVSSFTPEPLMMSSPNSQPPFDNPQSMTVQSLPRTTWGVVGTDQDSLNNFLRQFE